MKTTISLLVATSLVFLSGCASQGGNVPASTAADGNRHVVSEDQGGPSKLVPDVEEVPREIREIEVQIDRRSVILADEVEIIVSKNYQSDISLTGNEVTKDLDKSGANERIAHGKSIAFLRNLEIRGDNAIKVRIADFGTRPFIKVRATGHCSHVIPGENSDDHEVRRAHAIAIDNASIRYVSEPFGAASARN